MYPCQKKGTKEERKSGVVLGGRTAKLGQTTEGVNIFNIQRVQKDSGKGAKRRPGLEKHAKAVGLLGGSMDSGKGLHNTYQEIRLVKKKKRGKGEFVCCSLEGGTSIIGKRQ